ncbi:MAG: polyprenyl synthetase family protein [Nitrososphaeria archaeon]|jgi:octaprenyl-diphosphate synthase
MQIEAVFNEMISNVMPDFDDEFKRTLDSYDNEVLIKMINYAVGGGKRLRPLIMVLINKNLGERFDVSYASFSIELMHNLSLIHDDFIDKEETRRDHVPFYKIYGYDNALLVTDYIFGVVIDLINQYKMPEAINTLAKTSIKMSEGELEELALFNKKENVSLKEYLRVINYKTASLFGAAAKLGALLSQSPQFAEKAYYFGENLGIIYQIKDDVKDKKHLFNELINKLKPEEQKSLNQIVEKSYNDALKYLREFPQNEYNKMLLDLTDLLFKA